MKYNKITQTKYTYKEYEDGSVRLKEEAVDFQPNLKGKDAVQYFIHCLVTGGTVIGFISLFITGIIAEKYTIVPFIISIAVFVLSFIGIMVVMCTDYIYFDESLLLVKYCTKEYAELMAHNVLEKFKYEQYLDKLEAQKNKEREELAKKVIENQDYKALADIIKRCEKEN